MQGDAAPVRSREQQRNEFPPRFKVGLLKSTAQNGSLILDAPNEVAFGRRLAGSGLCELDVLLDELALAGDVIQFLICDRMRDGAPTPPIRTSETWPGTFDRVVPSTAQ